MACLATAAQSATRYTCTFDGDNKRGGNWVAPLVVVDDAGDKVMVYDDIIRHYKGQPIPARLADQTAARVTYTWSVDITTGSPPQSARMIYRLTHYRNGLPAAMSVHPAGYDNAFSGNGTCKVSTR